MLALGLLAGNAPAFAADHAQPAGGLVGVYDSRVVAYAYFWSKPVAQERNALLARAMEAKAAGDAAALKDLNARLGSMQRQSMLEVFSTAPADEAFAALGEKLPAIESQLGVAGLVSKWDSGALGSTPAASRVDATDALVRALCPKPNQKMQDMIASIEAAKPIPLWEAKVMSFFSGM
jgi:hypothetical protein